MKRTTKTDTNPVLCASCGRVMQDQTSYSRDACYAGPLFSFVCSRCGMETPRVAADTVMDGKSAKKAAEYLARQLYRLVRIGAWIEGINARELSRSKR